MIISVLNIELTFVKKKPTYGFFYVKYLAKYRCTGFDKKFKAHKK